MMDELAVPKCIRLDVEIISWKPWTVFSANCLRYACAESMICSVIRRVSRFWIIVPFSQCRLFSRKYLYPSYYVPLRKNAICKSINIAHVRYVPLHAHSRLEQWHFCMETGSLYLMPSTKSRHYRCVS